MTQVFLSHSTHDSDFVAQLAEDLVKAGFRVWKAPQSIDPGTGWVASIERGLTTSTHFVLVMSPTAVSSRWVPWETDIAIRLERAGRIKIVPLAYQDCNPPLRWGFYQHIDIKSDYHRGLFELVGRLNAEKPSNPPTQVLTLRDSSIEGDMMVAGGSIIVNNYNVRPEDRPPEPPTELDEELDDLPTLPAVPPISERTLQAVEAVMAVLPGPFAWCEIPAGIASLAETQTVVRVPTTRAERRSPMRAAYIRVPEFVMAQYPITYAQFETFVAAEDGFRDPRWWRGLTQQPDKPGDQKFKVADHPRDRVSWYDAVAFCRWLSAHIGFEVRLPNEAEWQRAAQDDDDRPYPWGSAKPDTHLANFGGHIGGTSPVTAYPAGASKYGVVGLAGNVWEWVDLTYTRYGDQSFRTARGGAWDSPPDHLRVNQRGWNARDGRRSLIGFRIAATLT